MEHDTLWGSTNPINLPISRGFLLRQLWIVKYYVRCSSNNLSNENINTGVSREMIFQK